MSEIRLVTSVLYEIENLPLKPGSDIERKKISHLPASSRPFTINLPKSLKETAQESNTIIINVKILKPTQVLKIHISSLLTINELKKYIEKQAGIPVADQKLLFNGKGLSEANSIQDSGLISESTVHLMNKPSTAPQSIIDPLQNKLLDQDFWNKIRISIDNHFEVQDRKKIRSAILTGLNDIATKENFKTIESYFQ